MTINHFKRTLTGSSTHRPVVSKFSLGQIAFSVGFIRYAALFGKTAPDTKSMQYYTSLVKGNPAGISSGMISLNWSSNSFNFSEFFGSNTSAYAIFDSFKTSLKSDFEIKKLPSPDFGLDIFFYLKRI
jgi:hypothetical protein